MPRKDRSTLNNNRYQQTLVKKWHQTATKEASRSQMMQDLFTIASKDSSSHGDLLVDDMNMRHSTETRRRIPEPFVRSHMRIAHFNMMGVSAIFLMLLPMLSKATAHTDIPHELHPDSSVATRETRFNPMDHLEVLEHGKTRVASFPDDPICCSLRAINVPNSLEDYNYGPYSSLHVTSIGFLGDYMRGDGPYNLIYSSVNHPGSFRSFIFEVGNSKRNDGESRCADFLVDRAEVTSDANITTTRSHQRRRVGVGPIREAGFTFFAPESSVGKTAVMICTAIAPSSP